MVTGCNSHEKSETNIHTTIRAIIVFFILFAAAIFPFAMVPDGSIPLLQIVVPLFCFAWLTVVEMGIKIFTLSIPVFVLSILFDIPFLLSDR
jgi:hypothetical protein